MTTTELTVAADHPAYAGHFPGTPMLPAVVLLDAVLAVVEAGAGPARWQISAAKFLGAVRPGEPLTLEHDAQINGSIRFAVRSRGRAVASGTLLPCPFDPHDQQG